jgi:hypothetical protein
MSTRNRQPFTPAEFDAVCRVLISRCPWLSETSGYRSSARNEQVGGSPLSKHRLGLARDFAATNSEALLQGKAEAENLGLWSVVHKVSRGGGEHLHIQGLPPGTLPPWWAQKYGGFET